MFVSILWMVYLVATCKGGGTRSMLMRYVCTSRFDHCSMWTARILSDRLACLVQGWLDKVHAHMV